MVAPVPGRQYQQGFIGGARTSVNCSKRTMARQGGLTFPGCPGGKIHEAYTAAPGCRSYDGVTWEKTGEKPMSIRKVKVGILTFSDGRKYIHETLVELNQGYQDRLTKALEATGQVEVVAGEEIIWTPEGAQREGRRLQ